MMGDYGAGGPLALLCMIAGTTMIATSFWGLAIGGALLIGWSALLIWATDW